VIRWEHAPGPYEVVFSTREGGVSEGPFASLNLGRATADESDRVDENRRRLCAEVGADPDALTMNYQHHSTDVLRARAWPEAGASLEDWVEALAAGSNDLEAPAMRIQPVIGEVIAALNATNGAWLARMSGSGATCFAIYENTADAQRAAQKIQLDHPGWWVHAGILS